ncbi:MAG: erythromycin esterase family protein [Flavobacterium sp.]|nr:erythromycin esterase family protein [Flavobacterium sp.]
MKKNFTYFIFLFYCISNAQETAVLEWINSNAIPIEDVNPNSPLLIFDQKAPQLFKDAQLFGFGEASHHSKEFFDLKTKFFKYLVEHKGVTVFMMEESYQAEKGINEWISGGKGNRLSVVENFTIAPWYCNEVVDLLEWMRNYNQGKPKEAQIRFYGIDSQDGKGLAAEIRAFINKHEIDVTASLLEAADACEARLYHVKNNKTWALEQLQKLDALEQQIVEHQKKSLSDASETYAPVLRTLQYLKNYTLYLQNPKTDVRDEQMFKNALWLMNTVEKDSKVFIWAHNEHINKKGHSNHIINLGYLLKKEYGSKYYCVGFDFGTGKLLGVTIKKGKVTGWNYHPLTEPYKNTYAETLNKANNAIYFIDMELALATEPTGFFSKENRNLGLGGPGFNPKKPILMKRSYAVTYDGLLFVKTISKSTNKISE